MQYNNITYSIYYIVLITSTMLRKIIQANMVPIINHYHYELYLVIVIIYNDVITTMNCV